MHAMVQTDLKRMLAFSTVSQIGYMMLGLGIGTPLAITAGLLHCLNHGFFKGGLFLNAGAVQHGAGTRDMNQLGGLAQRMPRTTLWWLIGAGNMMGIPLMSGFVSKWMLYAAALQAGWVVPAMVAWVVSLGTVFLCAKATSAVFLGPLTDATSNAQEAPPTMQWGMGLLAAGSIVLGVAPQLAVNYFLNPVLSALSLGEGMRVTWFGLFAGAGSFSTTGGLVLAIVSLVLGGAIYAVAYAARTATAVAVVGGGPVLAAAGHGVFTGGEPLSDQGRLSAGDFSAIFQQNWQAFFRWSNVDRVYLGVWTGLQAASRWLGVAVALMERRAAALVLVLAAVVLAAAKWLRPGEYAWKAYAGKWELAAPIAIPTHVPAPLVAACVVASVALIVAALSQKHWRRFVPLMVLAGAFTTAGLMVADPRMRIGLLELGAFASVGLIWQSARSRTAKFTYLAVVALSAFAAASELISSDPFWIWAFLLTGVCIKLAAIPFLFWLLLLADEVPALVLGLIIAVVDMAAFGEFFVTSWCLPDHAGFAPSALLLSVAAVTSLIAALLMLSQRSLKRLLVLSTIEDVGFLLFGVFSLKTLGYNGATIAASTHALAKALLFACLSAPEGDGALNDESVGLARRYPISAFGFLFGMLAMLGVPPTLGYIGRWRLYETALQISPYLLAAFILSSIFALIAYVLALTRNWWGPEREGIPLAESAGAREPIALRGTIVVLVVLLLVAGLWPHGLRILEQVTR